MKLAVLLLIIIIICILLMIFIVHDGFIIRDLQNRIKELEEWLNRGDNIKIKEKNYDRTKVYHTYGELRAHEEIVLPCEIIFHEADRFEGVTHKYSKPVSRCGFYDVYGAYKEVMVYDPYGETITYSGN